MKSIALGLALVVALPTVPAQAQSSAATAAKAGEIPLRITARGEVEADAAVLLANVSTGGTDRAATEAQLHQDEQAMIAALGKIGIPAANVSVSAPKIEELDQTVVRQRRFGFSEAMAGEMPASVEAELDSAQAAADAAAAAVDAAAMAAEQTGNPRRKPKEKQVMVKTWAASSVLTITVTKLDQLPEAMRLAKIGAYGEKPVRFVFNDEAAAQRTAIARALANARTEAEAYAAAMNYRIVRISGLSNTEPPMSINDGMRAISRFGGRGKELGMLAIRFATVNVDYSIAPK